MPSVKSKVYPNACLLRLVPLGMPFQFHLNEQSPRFCFRIQYPTESGDPSVLPIAVLSFDDRWQWHTHLGFGKADDAVIEIDPSTLPKMDC